VDDNPVNTLVAEAELRALGVDVHAVDGGQAAVDWFRANSPDMVLMDCEMPGMDGPTATRLMRDMEGLQRRAQVAIVALTANGREAYEERCVPAGMDDYLCKPFDQADLANLLSRHLPRLRHQDVPELADAMSGCRAD
jgi:CheY-like chemotaxis protein